MTETRSFNFDIPAKYQDEFRDKLAEVLEWYGDHYNSINVSGEKVTLSAERPVDPWDGLEK